MGVIMRLLGTTHRLILLRVSVEEPHHGLNLVDELPNRFNVYVLNGDFRHAISVRRRSEPTHETLRTTGLTQIEVLYGVEVVTETVDELGSPVHLFLILIKSNGSYAVNLNLTVYGTGVRLDGSVL